MLAGPKTARPLRFTNPRRSIRRSAIPPQLRRISIICEKRLRPTTRQHARNTVQRAQAPLARRKRGGHITRRRLRSRLRQLHPQRRRSPHDGRGPQREFQDQSPPRERGSRPTPTSQRSRHQGRGCGRRRRRQANRARICLLTPNNAATSCHVSESRRRKTKQSIGRWEHPKTRFYRAMRKREREKEAHMFPSHLSFLCDIPFPPSWSPIDKLGFIPLMSRSRRCT